MTYFFKNLLYTVNDWLDSKWGRRIWTIFVVAVLMLYSANFLRDVNEGDAVGAIVGALIILLYIWLLWLDIKRRHADAWAEGYVDGMFTGIKIAVGAGPDATSGEVEVSVELTKPGSSRIIKEQYDYRERDDTGADPLPEHPKSTL